LLTLLILRVIKSLNKLGAKTQFLREQQRSWFTWILAPFLRGKKMNKKTRLLSPFYPPCVTKEDKKMPTSLRETSVKEREPSTPET